MQQITEYAHRAMDSIGIHRGAKEVALPQDFVQQAQNASLIEVEPMVEHKGPHIRLGGDQPLSMGNKKQRIRWQASFDSASRPITYTHTYATIPPYELNLRDIAAHKTLLTADMQVKYLQLNVPETVSVQLAGSSGLNYIRLPLWDEAREQGVTPFVAFPTDSDGYLFQWIQRYHSEGLHDGFLHYFSTTAIQNGNYPEAVVAMRRIIDPKRYEEIQNAFLNKIEGIAVTTSDKTENYAHIAQGVQHLWSVGMTDQEVADFILLRGLGDIFQIRDETQAAAIINAYKNLQPAEEHREQLQNGARLRWVGELLGGVVTRSYVDEQLDTTLLEKNLQQLAVFSQPFSILEKQGNITDAMLQHGDAVAAWLTDQFVEPTSFEDVGRVLDKLQQISRKSKN